MIHYKEFYGIPEGLYHSTDNGTSWSKVDTLLISGLAPVDTNRCFGTFNGRVFLSTDNGLSWAALDSISRNIQAGSLLVYDSYLYAGTNSGVWRIPLNETLPIQLATFKAVAIGDKGVALSWTTASETNNYGFYVQRNGADITFVPGHGTTLQQHTYSYIDNPLPGQYQYRLKQVDLDGSVRFQRIMPLQSGAVSTPDFRSFAELSQPFQSVHDNTLRLAPKLTGSPDSV